MRRRCSRRELWLAFFALWLAVFTAGAADPVARIIPVGASDGQIKILADSAELATTFSVESNATVPLQVTVRASPFRDVTGRSHPVAISVAGGTAGPSSTELSATVPTRGILELTVKATLPESGEYTGEIVFLHGEARDVVRLGVTRGTRALGVELQSVDPTRASADVLGTSSAQLRATLRETGGRQRNLEAPLVTRFTRKEAGGTRTQADYGLEIDGAAPAEIRLQAGESKLLMIGLKGLVGAGEYQGTLRISAPGSAPVDQEFVLTLREPAWWAALIILFGVGLSAYLRHLSQEVRPRLLETRRGQLLVRELDELLAQPTNDNDEREVMQALRREAFQVLLSLELDSLEASKVKFDSVTERRKLLPLWLVQRRRVVVLEPPALRERFRPTIDAVRAVLLNATATTAEVADAKSKLAALDKDIPAAVSEELRARIKQIRDALQAAVMARPDSELALTGMVRVEPLLDLAEGERTAGNLSGALQSYAAARTLWIELSIDDLAQLLRAAAPLGIDAGKWLTEAAQLQQALDEARRLTTGDQEAAARTYDRVWARYLALASRGLADELPKIDLEIEQDQEAEDEDKKAAQEELQKARDALQAAQAAIGERRFQDALVLLNKAVASAERSRAKLARAVRGATRELAASGRSPLLGGELPPALASATPDLPPVSIEDLTLTSRRLERINRLALIVSLLIATLLGLTTLWAPDATWGGWEDWIVALLWGLGMHQFTFAGIGALQDRLMGSSAGAKP